MQEVGKMPLIGVYIAAINHLNVAYNVSNTKNKPFGFYFKFMFLFQHWQWRTIAFLEYSEEKFTHFKDKLSKIIWDINLQQRFLVGEQNRIV